MLDKPESEMVFTRNVPASSTRLTVSQKPPQERNGNEVRINAVRKDMQVVRLKIYQSWLLVVDMVGLRRRKPTVISHDSVTLTSAEVTVAVGYVATLVVARGTVSGRSKAGSLVTSSLRLR